MSAVALGGLFGQCLDLVSHHREATAGLAGARGFDRGIERQKIGLLCDRLDQAADAVNPLCRGGETFDLGDRLFGALAACSTTSVE